MTLSFAVWTEDAMLRIEDNICFSTWAGRSGLRVELHRISDIVRQQPSSVSKGRLDVLINPANEFLVGTQVAASVAVFFVSRD